MVSAIAYGAVRKSWGLPPLCVRHQFNTAHFDDLGTEHELCSVFTGEYLGNPTLTARNQHYQWMSAPEVAPLSPMNSSNHSVCDEQQLKSRGMSGL